MIARYRMKIQVLCVSDYFVLFKWGLVKNLLYRVAAVHDIVDASVVVMLKVEVHIFPYDV